MPITEAVTKKIHETVLKEMEAETPEGAEKFVCLNFEGGKVTLKEEAFQGILGDEDTNALYETKVLAKMKKFFPDYQEQVEKMKKMQGAGEKNVAVDQIFVEIPPEEKVQHEGTYNEAELKNLRLVFLNEKQAALCNPTDKAVSIKAGKILNPASFCFFWVYGPVHSSQIIKILSNLES